MICNNTVDLERNYIYKVIERSNYPEFIYDYIYNPIIGKKTIQDPLSEKLSNNEKSMENIIRPDQLFSIRLDGKKFSSIVPKLRKLGIFEEGYSITFENIMKEVLLYSANLFQRALYCFSQSDEITIIIDKVNDLENSVHEFKERKDKFISLSSGYISTKFYQILIKHIINNQNIEDKIKCIDLLPEISFDSRIGTYNTLYDAFELILQRAYDCSVNGISQAIYLSNIIGSKKLKNLNTSEKLKYLNDNNMLPLRDHQSYGILLKKELSDNVECVNKLTGVKTIKSVIKVKQINGPVIANIKNNAFEIKCKTNRNKNN